MDLRNVNGIEFRNFYFTTISKLLRKFSPEVEKCIMWGSIQVLPNQISKNLSLCLMILTYESPMQSNIKKSSETLGADLI